MPTLTKRSDRVVTLNSVTKAYPDFSTVDPLMDNEFEFTQGSKNFIFAGNVTGPGFEAAFARFDDTGYGVASFSTAAAFWSSISQLNAESNGYIHTGFFDAGTGDLIFYCWRGAFDPNGGNQASTSMTEITTNLGAHVGTTIPLVAGGMTNYQVEWPTGKTLFNMIGQSATKTYLCGVIFDGTATPELINIAEFDYTTFRTGHIIGNNRTGTDNIAAAFMANDDSAAYYEGFLVRIDWTAETFGNGLGTFASTSAVYDFDDAAINADIAASHPTGPSPAKLGGVAQPNGCNYLFARRSGRYTGDTDTPYMIVVSRDWDWYDKVTFIAGDATAAIILDSYKNGTHQGNIAYHADEGVLYFASGLTSPFTYCIGAFDPCEGSGGRRRQLTKIYAA